MGRYIALRILQAIPVVLGTTLLIYFLVFAMPGDPIAAMFGDKQPPAGVVQQIRDNYHLNDPFIVQYFYFLKGVFTLDLGNAFNGRPIAELIGAALPVTAVLAGLAFVFEILIGVTCGIVAGIKRRSIFDNTVLIISLVLISIPTFVMGYVLQFVLGVQLKILPTTVGSNVDLLHMLMPALVLAGVSIAYIFRLTRGEMAQTLLADHVRTARAKGLTAKQVTLRHVFRNSLMPLVTYVGTDLAALMGGALVTETVFNIHGIGYLMYTNIHKGDGTVVVSVVAILVLAYVVSNIIVDCLYALLDPRIRVGKKVSSG
ncbi:MAG: ABC transporter permease [Candidatus Ancillula sp.]|jgi:oligopeptide transport system permease protein|nr:ABC transporter permease [Candidatus Ancillula sp.]